MRSSGTQTDTQISIAFPKSKMQIQNALTRSVAIFAQPISKFGSHFPFSKLLPRSQHAVRVIGFEGWSSAGFVSGVNHVMSVQ